MRYEQKKMEYESLYEDFLKEKVGGKRMQDAYLDELKEHKANMREYMKQFRLKKMNLLKVCAFVCACVCVLEWYLCLNLCCSLGSCLGLLCL